MNIVIQTFPDAYNSDPGVKHQIISLRGDKENLSGFGFEVVYEPLQGS